ncbi:probable protein phosphatase 2C 8 isoform X2 [Abrus precatorius]|uniref:Probable protein phosphatase 2C 8 isoform X2 n=1 Tax=Abrus precatorius TaxID=3816 RepID=A0A8B8LQY9_ABRPR|nr:probable protein phosphatase 2C 8 isoform X2 [Abrus precatorius]
MNESTESQKREADSESKEDGVASKKVKIESSVMGSDENGVNQLTFHIEADAAEDKGSRHAMEDAWVLLPDASLDYPGNLRCAHFAIYDGHGGRLAAEYAQKHLHGNVLSAGLPRELLDIKTAKRSILDGFRKTDESLLQESSEGGWQDGATAVCVWVLGQKAGGFVSSDGRLQGRLEVSRAFGDRQLKKVGVTATPDIYSFDLTDRVHFIILGCDGLWGVFGPSDAVDFVRKLLNEGLPVTSISRRLVREAVRERRCKDNCTAIVIVFKRN